MSTRLALVREAGGFGDILSCTAAARQWKRENPCDEVCLYIPTDFVELATRMEGPDQVIGMGAVEDIHGVRRQRDAAMDAQKFPYLQPVFDGQHDQIIDLYCPAYRYESSEAGRLRWNRPQLFAMACGCREVHEVRPAVSHVVATMASPDGRNLIGFAPRATCAARSLSPDLQQAFLAALVEAKLGHVWYLDCIPAPFDLPRGANAGTNLSLDLLIAIALSCRYMICVDSFLLHLAAAVGCPTLGIFGPTDGRVTVQTYPHAIAADGCGEVCTQPCCYNEQTKLWNRGCRKAGCQRMEVHTVSGLLGMVKEHLWTLEQTRRGTGTDSSEPSP